MPPKAQVFRRFVVLDAPSVLAALSALDGGAVDEILTRRVNESDRDFGVDVSVPAVPVKGRAKRAKGQRVEEELRQVRTEHSAASALIDGLKAREAVGTLDGALDDDVLGQISPGMVVELGGRFSPHPLFQLDSVIRSYLQVAPKIGQAKEAQQLRSVLPMFQSVAGTGDESGHGDGQAARVIAVASRPSLQIDLDDVNGSFATLAQIDEIFTAPDEALFTMRLMRGAPPSSSEREAIVGGTQLLIDAAAELGVELAQADLAMPSPLVVLRPLCIWR